MRILIFLILVLTGLKSSVVLADSSDLKERWGVTVSEEESRHAVHFNPFRIMNRTLDSVIHFGVGVIDLAKFKTPGHFSAATYQFAESFLDPFLLTNDVISDIGAAGKSTAYVNHRMSTRIQVCTGDLGLIFDDGKRKYPLFSWLYDIEHIGILMDSYESFVDSAGGGLTNLQDKKGADCSPVPIMSNEPEAVAMQRLNYIGYYYKPKYNLADSNCGYSTRDVLNFSGLAYPILPNAGIGTEFPLTFKQTEFKEQKKSDLQTLLALKSKSDTFLEKLRTVFNELENGTVPDVEFEIADRMVLSADADFQIIASASRGKNAQAQAWVVANIVPADTLYWSTNLIKQGKSVLHSENGKEYYAKMFKGVSTSDLAWFTVPDTQSEVVKFLSQISEQ